MALPYVAPGVLPITEIQSSPLIPANLISNIIPVVIGEAQGYQTFTESVVLSGTANTTLNKKGIIISATATPGLSFTVKKPATFETVGPANFIITQTAGTATGDESTDIHRITYPVVGTATPGGAGTAIAIGTYRYTASWVVDLDGGGGGTAQYESGISSTGWATATVGTAAIQIDLTGITPGTGTINVPGTVVGRNIYRSKNLGTTNNPNWGPWYRLTGSGTTTITANGTAVFTDTISDPSSFPQASAYIGDSETVSINYNYADTNYYLPTLFSDFNDVIDKYGSAFNSTGGIQSQLSFGIKLTMINGAQSVVGLPVPVGATSQNWIDALLRLEDDLDGSIIVPLNGTAAIHSLVNAHIATMKPRNVYKTAILGLDGVSQNVTPETLRANAQAFNSQDLVLIAPSVFTYFNSYINKEVEVGGHYAAAAKAGMHAARGPADSLSRKVVAGLSKVGEFRSELAKNADAGSGLTVIEQKGDLLRIRHDISTAPGDVNTREFPVTLQRNNMLKSVLEIIDSRVIGQMFADSSAPGKVVSIIKQVLDIQVRNRRLDSYTGLTARLSPNDPTTVEVRWQYKPIYTVHYVQISFGINLNTGNVGTGGINLII